MSRYTKEELGTLLEKQLRQALGAPGSKIAEERLRNMQFYKAEAIGELSAPAIPDRSSIVTSDVADTVNWMLPSLLRVFATSHDSMECEPRKPEMTPVAKLCGEYLKHIFWKRNKGFTVLYQWIKDALIQKVGFVRVFWEETETDSEESYTGLFPSQLEQLMSDPGIKVIEQTESLIQIGFEFVPVFDVKVKRTETEGRCRVLPCAPEEMRIHPDARYGQEFPFIAHVRKRRRNELEADGYDLTDVTASDSWGVEESERYQEQGYNWTDDDGELEMFECSDCFIKLDQDKDGIPEWRHVFMIGQTVMSDEKVDDHDFVYFCPSPMPHTFFGDCPADEALGPQRLGTSLIRAMLDNVYLSVNQRVGVVEGQVNLDDLMINRPGGIVRMKQPNAIFPLQQPGLGADAFQMVEWGTQWREQRTGFTRYSQGLSPDALNPTATGVSLITEKADQRTELIARVAAETAVRVMFEKILKCICKYQNKADQVHLLGEWINIDPREWADCFNIEISVGLGTGSKDKQAMVMQQLIGMQGQMIGAGIVDKGAAIPLAVKFADAAGIPSPEQYFPPAQPQPPQPSPDAIKAQAQQQIENAKIQAQGQMKQLELQQQAQLEQQRMLAQQQTDIVRQQAESEQQALKRQGEADQHALKVQSDAQLEQLRMQMDDARHMREYEFLRWRAELESATKIETANISSKSKIDNAATQAATDEIDREVQP